MSGITASAIVCGLRAEHVTCTGTMRTMCAARLPGAPSRLGRLVEALGGGGPEHKVEQLARAHRAVAAVEPRVEEITTRRVVLAATQLEHPEHVEKIFAADARLGVGEPGAHECCNARRVEHERRAQRLLREPPGWSPCKE